MIPKTDLKNLPRQKSLKLLKPSFSTLKIDLDRSSEEEEMQDDGMLKIDLEELEGQSKIIKGIK